MIQKSASCESVAWCPIEDPQRASLVVARFSLILMVLGLDVSPDYKKLGALKLEPTSRNLNPQSINGLLVTSDAFDRCIAYRFFLMDGHVFQEHWWGWRTWWRP